MWLALLLNRTFRGKRIVRASMLLPFIIPTVLSTFAWRWMFDPTFSVLNWLLYQTGFITTKIPFLSDGTYGMWCAIVVNTWRGMPFFAITLLAGLQTINPDLQEAASLDGANGWRRFWHVTSPLLKPVTIVVVVFSIIQTFSDFQLIYVLTGGGPANSTHLVATYAYQVGVATGLLGEGAAISLFMLPVLFIVVWAQLRYLRRLEGAYALVIERKWKKWVFFYIPLTIFVIGTLFPFYWMLITAIRPDAELYRSWRAVNNAPFWTLHPTVEHFRDLMAKTTFPIWLWNTFFIAIVSTLISLFCGLLAGYALARLRFPMAGALGTSIFVTYLVPPTLLFIPLADIIRNFQLGNTPWALILTYPTFLIPFCTWLLMGYFKTIPKELEECARIDGATRFGAMTRIIFPIAVPGSSLRGSSPSRSRGTSSSTP